MPRSSGLSNMTTPALKQARFPGRRRNARLRASMLGSEKEKRQSSLTQMDFGTPSNTDEVIDISSDSDDEEFQEPQPKKKQRLPKTNNASARKPTSKRLSMKLPRSRQDVGESQNTFTQMGYMPSAWSRKTKDEMDDDEFGLNILDDEEIEARTIVPKRKKLFTSWKDRDSDTTKREIPRRDDAPSDKESTPGLPTLKSPTTRYNLRSPPKRASTPPNLASHSIAARDFTTPKKFAEVEEIPSSQTPASIKLSASRMQRSQPRAGFQRSPLKDKSLQRSQPRAGLRKSPIKQSSLQRSPLKEKSTNVPPQAFNTGSPESQNPVAKDFERIRHGIMQEAAKERAKAAVSEPSALPALPTPQPEPLAFVEPKQVTLDLEPSVIDEPNVEVDDTADLPNSPEDGKITTGSQKRKRSTDAEEDTKTAAIPTQPLSRPFKRTHTVQDSQQESLSWPTQRPPRKVKRSHTVQDSQHEDLDMSSSIFRVPSGETLLQHSDFAMYSDDQQNNTYSMMEPQTYDPAHAALDRDAARFAWTQTQMPVSRVADSVAGSPERIAEDRDPEMEAEAGVEDEDEDDLDRGIVPASDDEDDEVVMLPNPAHGTSEGLGHDIRDAAEPPAEESAVQPAPIALDHEPTAIDHNDQPSNLDPSSSPSPPSSPPVHPSQISTVVPTQSSPRRTRNNRPDTTEDDSPPTSPPAPGPPRYRYPTFAKVAVQDPQTLPQSAVSLSHSAITLSSSPLPLPPWTSSDRGRWEGSSPTQQKRMGTQAKEIESLQDFSLPPPPPMFRTSSPFNRTG